MSLYVMKLVAMVIDTAHGVGGGGGGGGGGGDGGGGGGLLDDGEGVTNHCRSGRLCIVHCA